MKTSPLRLDDSFLGEIRLKPPASLPEADSVSTKVEVNLAFARHSTDPAQWQVQMSVSFDAEDETPAFSGFIEITGHFTVVVADLPEEKSLKLVAVNAPSILYSTAREVLLNLSARGNRGKFLLPSVSFIDQIISPTGDRGEKGLLAPPTDP